MALPEQLGFKTAFFDLPGLRMHAAVAGPVDGQPVVLLHGFPEFWYSWRKQIPALTAAGFRVLAPDQRGYNLTGKQPPYDIMTLVGDIVHLLDANGWPTAYVVGHDWGAAVAWALAGAHPTRVSKLAILNVPHPQVMFKALLGSNLKQILRSWYIFFFQIPGLPEAMLSSQNFANMRRLMQRSAQAHTFTAADLQAYQTAWAQPGALTAMIGWYRSIWQSRSRAAQPEANRPLPMPALILWGEQDQALGVELAEASQSYLTQGRLVRYPQATHWVHEDLPNEVNQQLLAHFQS